VQVDNLPLVNRNVYQLLSLTPGVQGNNTSNTQGFPEQHVYINGSADSFIGQVSFYLDGGLNMTGIRNTGNVLPNPDAIDQFAVQTSNFSAQFGRSSAAIVTVLTKSGTNQFHGSAFEFYRSKNFNATQHVNTLTQPAGSKQEYVQHNFGATVGGPIIKDKTFFFASYQGFRYSYSQLLSAVVPDALQRTGNFQENLATDISTCTQSPTAADVAALKFLVCNPTTRLPYKNNIITDPLDPTVQNILNANVPLPNGPNNTRADQQNLSQYSNQYLIKVDHQLNKTNRLTAMYFQPKGYNVVLPGGGTIANWSTALYTYRQQNANLSDVWTVNPHSVNQVWAAYTRQVAGRVNNPAKSIGDFGSAFNIQGPKQLPQIAVSGWFTLAQAIDGPYAGTNVYALRDVYSTTLGKHSLFIGGETALEKDGVQSELNDYGVFAFANSTSARTGNALSDFILGRPNSMNQDAPIYANASYWNHGLFVQDDWHILPRLTVNLGLRYDIQTAPVDNLHRVASYVQGSQSVVLPGAPQGLLFPGDKGVISTGVSTKYNHVSPRFGFAYDAFGNGRTVVHGAAGLFFGSVSGNFWTIPSNNEPFGIRAKYTHVVSVTNPYATDTTDFPGGVSPYPYVYSPSSPRFLPTGSPAVFDPNYKWPYNYQINFGVSQQLAKDLALSISYVGSLERKMPTEIDLNYPTFNTANPAANTAATTNARRPIQTVIPGSTNQAFAALYQITSNQTSNYNGLQMTVEKRLSHNFSINAYFTWSKALESVEQDGTTLTGNFEDYSNPKYDHSRTDYDIREQSVISAVWKPDYFSSQHRIARLALNGWTIAAIATMQSGIPFNITTGADNNNDGNTNDRPNVYPGKTLQVKNNGGSRQAAESQWFVASNLCGYSITNPAACPGRGPAGSDGTIAYNALDAPGVRDVDASIFRNFKIVDRVQFQLRGEATNVFNLVNLGTPVNTLTSSQAGQITGTNTTQNGGTFGARIIQVGGRILF
jgi:outer membrane receptor protein involved in Fe transport